MKLLSQAWLLLILLWPSPLLTHPSRNAAPYISQWDIIGYSSHQMTDTFYSHVRMGSPCWFGLLHSAMWESLAHSILRLGELISLKQPSATAQGLRYFPVIYTWNEDEAGKDSKI